MDLGGRSIIAALALALGLATACGGTSSGAGAGGPTAAPGAHANVFVVAMESHTGTPIYGNASAPYINDVLVPAYARATAFDDELPELPSQPHYMWMEAGTNAFADHTFTTDDSPSASNSTSSGDHLAAQIEATGRLAWISYQEDMDAATTGSCPIKGSGNYAPRHDPFLYFQDVSGSPPSAGNEHCAAHHRPLAALGADLGAHAVGDYNFITPNLCHDMHGGKSCGSGDIVRMGDDWLRATLPALIAHVNANGGVIFVVWDEDAPIPFLAIGPDVKRGYAGPARYDHASLLRTVEQILGLPVLPAAASAADLSDLFASGSLPAAVAVSRLR